MEENPSPHLTSKWNTQQAVSKSISSGIWKLRSAQLIGTFNLFSSNHKFNFDFIKTAKKNEQQRSIWTCVYSPRSVYSSCSHRVTFAAGRYNRFYCIRRIYTVEHFLSRQSIGPWYNHANHGKHTLRLRKLRVERKKNILKKWTIDARIATEKSSSNYGFVIALTKINQTNEFAVANHRQVPGVVYLCVFLYRAGKSMIPMSGTIKIWMKIK